MIDKTNLRTGLSTGSCATAASVAALWTLLGHDAPSEVSFQLPRDGWRTMPIVRVERGVGYAVASVIKDGGDDPDATHGAVICSRVEFLPTNQIDICGGEGVGVVTLPGLGLEIGEPAINPVPRQMIRNNLSAIYPGGLRVTISVPDGREIAKHTFNEKVGVVGGISILGTTGIVHPFSHEALLLTIEREMQVAIAMGMERIVLNSGKRSELYIHEQYPSLPPQAYIHYGNFIGDALRTAERLSVPRLTLGVMIGKAVKLAAGFENTHSHQVTMDRDFVSAMAKAAGCSYRTIEIIENINLARQLLTDLPREEFLLFRPMIIEKCLETCKRVYSGDLEFILLDSLY